MPFTDMTAYLKGYADEMMSIEWLKPPYEPYTVEHRRWVDGRVKAIQDKRAKAK